MSVLGHLAVKLSASVDEFNLSISELAQQMDDAAQSVGEFSDATKFVGIAREAGIDPTPENYERWCAVKRRLMPKPKRSIEVTRIRTSVLIPKDTVYLVGGGDVIVHPSQVAVLKNIIGRGGRL